MEKKEKELLKKGTKTLQEFKEFIAKGNVVDLAVGVIIGSAFGKIVTSLVNDILMPVIGMLIGGLDFSNLTIKVGDAVIAYGMFLQNVIDFLIVAGCVFFFVKVISVFNKKEEPKKEEKVVKKEEVILLEEIRDLLKEKSSKKKSVKEKK